MAQPLGERVARRHRPGWKSKNKWYPYKDKFNKASAVLFVFL